VKEAPNAVMRVAERVQVWAGLVPLAGYLVAHLLTEASALWGPLAHARWASREPRPGWLALEIALVYLPLLLHVGIGLARVKHRSPIALRAGPLAPMLQPLTGAVLLIFLAAHIYQFRFPVWTGKLAPSDYYSELCATLSSTRWGGVPTAAIGYLLGVAAAAVHCAHGLYRGTLRLGLVAAGRERAWARGCAVLGAGVFGLGALIVIDLATGSVLIGLTGS
jgi:succinate dehydrogenase/fumarate reductase cytochrome b subunit